MAVTKDRDANAAGLVCYGSVFSLPFIAALLPDVALLIPIVLVGISVVVFVRENIREHPEEGLGMIVTFIGVWLGFTAGVVHYLYYRQFWGYSPVMSAIFACAVFGCVCIGMSMLEPKRTEDTGDDRLDGS